MGELPFPEEYRELKDEMGMPDWRIAKKLGLSYDALERKLYRYRLPVSAELREMAREERRRGEQIRVAS